MAEWTSAWLAYDDVFSHGSKAGASPGRMREMADRLIAALDAPDVADPPVFLRPAVDVMRRMARGMSPQLRDRYIETTQGYLKGTVQEVEFRARRETPGWRDYLDMHILAGATWVLDTVEYGQGFDLTHELAVCRELREARRIAAEGVVMVNDLFSFEKEYFTGDHSNIVSSFMVTESLSLQGSIDRLCELIQDVERRFILKQAEVLAGSLPRTLYVPYAPNPHAPSWASTGQGRVGAAAPGPRGGGRSPDRRHPYTYLLTSRSGPGRSS
ncbi:terpene synthase family protein [Streptomyces sp. NBC_00212]|uniref:terpene synthase family protein n=1 Tax=Streptomyces sp. NBC_00212 TaxID=2975684 RepID=UPI003246C7D2